MDSILLMPAVDIIYSLGFYFKITSWLDSLIIAKL